MVPPLCRNEPYYELCQLGHVARDVAAEDSLGACGHEWAQAFPLTRLGLQSGGRQPHQTRCPERPQPSFPGCIVGLQDHLVSLKWLAMF